MPRLTVKTVLTELLGLIDTSPFKTNQESLDFFRICFKAVLHDRESLRREKKALEIALKERK